jgi:hypothetical protein
MRLKLSDETHKLKDKLASGVFNSFAVAEYTKGLAGRATNNQGDRGRAKTSSIPKLGSRYTTHIPKSRQLGTIKFNGLDGTRITFHINSNVKPGHLQSKIEAHSSGEEGDKSVLLLHDAHTANLLPNAHTGFVELF